MNWSSGVNALIQGILLGGLYALFAVGLSLVFGVMRLCNLAHGDMTILSAYIAFAVLGGLVGRFNPFYAIPIVMVIMFVLGYGLQRGLFNFVVTRGDMAGVIVTFGLSIVIMNALVQGFNSTPKGLNAGWIEQSSIRLSNNIAIGWLSLIIFLTGVAVVALLQLYMSRTRMGRAFRAVSDDQDAASLMGVNTKHIWAVAMGLAFLTLSIGGVMMGIRTLFDPTLGSQRLIFAFEAVIIGGMGSFWGTLLGGIVLGVAQCIGAWLFGPAWQVLAGHVVLVLVLVFRPQGFLAKTVTS